MFTGTKVIECFPTCIWTFGVENSMALNTSMLSKIMELQQENDYFEHGKAWQSRGNLHELPEFSPFVERIHAAGEAVMDFLEYEYDRLQITDCWANINRTGYSQRVHVHQNNFLSGVYYLKTPENCGQITFADPRPQANVFVPPIKRSTIYNGDCMRLSPREGDLLMFMSWLPHFVQPNESGQDRISVAFNLMVRGKMGYDKSSATF